MLKICRQTCGVEIQAFQADARRRLSSARMLLAVRERRRRMATNALSACCSSRVLPRRSACHFSDLFHVLFVQ